MSNKLEQESWVGRIIEKMRKGEIYRLLEGRSECVCALNMRSACVVIVLERFLHGYLVNRHQRLRII